MLRFGKRKDDGESFFVNHVLVGHAIGIVAALMPSALLSEICKALMKTHQLFGVIYQLVTTFMLAVPLLIGAAVAFQFKMKPIPMVCVAAAAWIGSGALKFTPNGVIVTGMGDLVNILVTVSMASGLVLLIGDRLKSFEPLLMPLIVCVIGGALGTLAFRRLCMRSQWASPG
ncbi:PTS sugar transporter subunit IIC [Terrilactibacillus sp. S3-3]|nr:PTS sugar transporter subunit IIC [Terrilactibacillus sp. S3-3]